MKWLLLLSFVLAGVASADDRLVRTTEPLSPADEQKALNLPDGFEITLFASEPMINKPINLAYDDRGRIWVSSTVEYPYAANKDRWSDEQGSFVRDSRDAIKILEDTDGDGRADKVTDFADGLNIPTGVRPWHKPEHRDGCIAWSIPNIWYFADTTGDGKCDYREVLFGPLGYEKDTHGMCSSFRLGRDGWVYATHGFNNTSVLKAKDGSQIELHSGNVFRFRPDGSTVELWSAGQVNPFGLCFDARGNLYSADCHSSPVYQLLQGAVYPSFGKPHDGIGFGPAMIEHTHGSTGICGIVYFDRDRWGSDWNDRVLIGNPVNSRINSDVIEFRGSTPVAVEQPDFVVSEDPWFRPVDLCLGDDGALYVADFYNRIIGHYEVPLDHEGRDRERGRIWRITRTGKSTQPAPLPEPFHFDNPIAELSTGPPFGQRRAAHQLQLAPRVDGLQQLLATLIDTPDDDTHLRHVLRMAIRETLKLPNAFPKAGESEVVSIALAVPTADAAGYLLVHGELGPETLIHIARYGTDEVIRKAIEKARPGGAIEAVQQGLDERGRVEPLPELIDWAQELAVTLLDQRAKIGDPLWIMSGDGEPPWILQKRMCQDGQEVQVLSSLRKGESGSEQRTGVIRSQSFPAPAAISFWICGHRGKPDQPANEASFVSLVDEESGKELHRAYPPRTDTCQKIDWAIDAENHGQSVAMQIVDGDKGGSYAWIGVTRIEPAAIDVKTFADNQTLDERLTQLAQMLKLSAPVSLRDRLKPWLPRPTDVVAPAPVSPERRKQLDDLIRERVESFTKAKPETAKGAEIFRQHCAACHQINREGGLIGPQLDGIGSRGVERLCQDILDPNRNVDAHFYLTQFKLTDGSEMSGFVIAERGELLQIRDAAGQMQRITKSQVETRETLPLSLMPAAFEQLISEAQLQQLLAWLLEQK